MEYAPEKFIFASLESGEIQHHSFFITGVKLGSFLTPIRPDGEYIGHLTNKRLILEPWKLPGFVGFAIDVVKTVATSLTPSDGMDIIIKDMAKQSKNSLAKTKFLVESKTYFSIPYKDIVAFETRRNSLIKDAYVCAITNVKSDKDGFTFTVAKIHENLKKGLPSGEWLPGSNRNFCSLGNQLLKSRTSMLQQLGDR